MLDRGMQEFADAMRARPRPRRASTRRPGEIDNSGAPGAAAPTATVGLIQDFSNTKVAQICQRLYVLHKLGAKGKRHSIKRLHQRKGTDEALRSYRGFDPSRQLCKGRDNSRAEINAVIH
jgi:hypothetical protein